jgi:hypothetical protein
MPDKKTVDRAKADLRAGKGPSTAAGEFVREEMHHIREGQHGARSTKQAIAIGLSKARRAGVPLKPPGRGQTSVRRRKSAERAYEVGQSKRSARSPSRRRSRATSRALGREGRAAASRTALSRQARRSARQRRGTERSPKAAARRAAATRMRTGVSKTAARKAARTRARRRRARTR